MMTSFQRKNGMQIWKDSAHFHLSNLKEVETIITKVDDVFKLKKEESKRLEWEIADLENQLEEIERSTEEYATTTATEGASLTWAKQSFGILEEEWNELCFSRTKEWSQVRNVLDESLAQGEEMIALFRTVHLRSNSLLEPMNNSIPLCHSELAQFSHGWQQIKNQSLEVAANIKDLENCTKICVENIGTIKSKIRAIMSAKDDLRIKLQYTEHQVAERKKEIEKITNVVTPLKIKEDEMNAVVSQLKNSCFDLSVDISNTEFRINTEKAMFDLDVQNIVEEKLQLHEKISGIMRENEMLSAQIQCSEEELSSFDREIETLSRQYEQHLLFLSDLESQKTTTKESICFMRSVLHNALIEHEENFHLSCLKLRELQDLQSKQLSEQNKLESSKLALKWQCEQTDTKLLEISKEVFELDRQHCGLHQQLCALTLESKVQEEMLGMQREDIQSRRVSFLEAAQIEKKLRISMEQLENDILDKSLLLQELENAKEDAAMLRATIQQRCALQQSEYDSLFVINQNFPNSPELSFDGFSREEELEIQQQTKQELSVIFRELETKHEQEVCALEDFRERIRQATVNNPVIQQLREEVAVLERNFEEACRADMKQTYPSRDFDNYYPLASSDSPKYGIDLKTSLNSRKRKFGHLLKEADDDMLSKISMEELFAEDM